MATITKYFVGGELEAFVQGSNASTTWTTAAGTYDPDFARGSVVLNTANGTEYIKIPLTSPQSVCWVSLQHYYQSHGLSGFSPGTVFQFFNSDSVALFRVQIIASSPVTQPTLQFQYWSGSAWTAIGAGLVVPTDARHKWDFNINSANSAGVLAAYADGILIGELTGDTSFVANSAVSEVRAYSSGVGGAASGAYISEVQILDVSTLGRRLATLGETANGTNVDWTGSVTDINEVGTFNDTNFIQSGTADQVSTFVTTDLSATAQTYNVSGLIIAGRALEGAVGPQNLKGAAVIGGTTYITADNVTGPFGLPTVFGYVWADFPDNPATGIDFTPAQINGIETGWKSLT